MTGFPYKFVAILIDSQMDGPERASSQLFLDLVLVDPMYSSAVILAVRVLRVSVKRLLHQFGA